MTDPKAFATKVNENDNISHWKLYDYVVVGGLGSTRHDSGMTVDKYPQRDRRFSEDPNVSILLIEAGNRCV